MIALDDLNRDFSGKASLDVMKLSLKRQSVKTHGQKRAEIKYQRDVIESEVMAILFLCCPSCGM